MVPCYCPSNSYLGCLRHQAVMYPFFWSNEMPLDKWDTIVLPQRDTGGFNTHQIGPKITALRPSTLHRYLNPEQASWKFFVTQYLRVMRQQLGTLTISTQFKPQHIDQSILTIHHELLLAWTKLYPSHTKPDPIPPKHLV